MDKIDTSDRSVDLGRRKFFGLLGVFVAQVSGLIPCRARAARTASPSYISLEYALGCIFRDQHSAREIGRIYLAAYPQENDLDRLACGLIDAAQAGGPRKLSKTIERHRVRDFSHEETVILHGWVLARVEARVCALLDLL